jgi:predicted ATP-grasp superfamily ATP-dependent carboligase
VLVTDAEQRCALAACRALVAAGYEVAAASSRRPAVAQWSHSCSRRIAVPNPRRDPAGFAERLRSELERAHYDVVLPGADASLLALSAHRARLEPLVRLGLPAHDVIEACLDKELLDRRAHEADFGQPITIRCLDAEKARAVAAEIGYPVILKPLRSYSALHGAERKPVVVATGGALAAAAEWLGPPFLVQAFLADAAIISCAAVAIDGELFGFVTSRYARVWPPTRGSVASSETFAPPAALRARVERLVAALGWNGVFELELLECRNGPPAVIDFNTRVYGSLALAVHAGANLPAIWCRYLVSRELIDAEAAVGLHYRWEDGELLSLLRAVTRLDLRTARTILGDRRDVVWAHYEAGDVGPLLARLIYLGQRGIETSARGTARAARRRGRNGALASTGGKS